MIGENDMYQTPTPADLTSWADRFGLTHPLVADPDFNVTARFLAPGSTSIGLPSMTLIGPGMKIHIADGFVQDSDIEALLPR